ncbi:MAG: ATP-binding cassette domain-containing protein [Spirochaetota bacterium]
MSADAIVSIDRLSVFAWDRARRRFSKMLRGIDFEVRPGELVLIIGESGSGKTTLLNTLAGVRSPIPGVAAGAVRMFGQTVSMAQAPFRRLGDGLGGSVEIPVRPATRMERYEILHREKRIGYIHQANREFLTPHLTVGELLNEAGFREGSQREQLIRRYFRKSRELGGELETVEESTYCRDLSGGQKMRLNVALTLEGRCKLVLADEPTTGLDTDSRKLVVDAFSGYMSRTVVLDRACVIVTHDMDFVKSLTEEFGKADGPIRLRKVFMYGGVIVQDRPEASLAGARVHPYFLDLHRLDHRVFEGIGPGKRLRDEHPSHSSESIHSGCVYVPRCSVWTGLGMAHRESCSVDQPGNHGIHCHFPPQFHADLGPGDAVHPTLHSAPSGARIILSLKGIEYSYGSGAKEFSLSIPSFEVAEGELVFIEGPSGAGKTTLLKIAAGILAPKAGCVEHRIPGISGKGQERWPIARPDFRRKVQYVFQETGLAYDPTMVAINIVAEAFDRLWPGVAAFRRQEIASAALHEAGLLAEKHYMPARRLSGGELKRILLMRALVALGYEPDGNEAPANSRDSSGCSRKGGLIFIDELTSGYDVVNVRRIVAMLERVRRTMGLTAVISSHDLRLDQCYPSERRIIDIKQLRGALPATVSAVPALADSAMEER